MPCSARDRFRRAVLAGLTALVGVGLGGCGSPKFYPVRGQVILFGVGPLTEGEVRFRPVSKPGLIATGRIGKDGSFSLSTPAHGDGVLVGRCRAAVVVEPRQGKPVIDERFGNFDTADLEYTVTAREENYFILEVSRPRR